MKGEKTPHLMSSGAVSAGLRVGLDQRQDMTQTLALFRFNIPSSGIARIADNGFVQTDQPVVDVIGRAVGRRHGQARQPLRCAKTARLLFRTSEDFLPFIDPALRTIRLFHPLEAQPGDEVAQHGQRTRDLSVGFIFTVQIQLLRVHQDRQQLFFDFQTNSGGD